MSSKNSDDLSSLSSDSFSPLLPSATCISKLDTKVKLWKTRYKTLHAKTEAKKRECISKLQLTGLSRALKRKTSIGGKITFLQEHILKLTNNNKELALSLGDQKLETKRHYTECIELQRELQAMREGVDHAVSVRLVELLRELFQRRRRTCKSFSS